MIHPNGLTIAIMGLGNLMRTDDALGMIAIQTIAKDSRFPSYLRLIEGGTLGLDLLDSLRGVTHVLAIDAVDIGAEPGTLSLFADDELANLPVSKSVHLLGFADLINVLKLMNAAPKHIALLGVQPRTIDWGTELTPAVAAAMKDLVDAALEHIIEWNVEGAAAQHAANLLDALELAEAN